MRMDLNEREGSTTPETDEIDRSGLWFMVQTLQLGFSGEPAVYHAEQLKDKDEGERLGPKFLELFPDRPVLLVGYDRQSNDVGHRAIAFLPDDPEWPGPKAGDIAMMMHEARSARDRVRNMGRRIAGALGRQLPALVTPAAAAGPDLTDHLYQNKQAFPQQQRADGTPAGELPTTDNPELIKAIDWIQNDPGGPSGGKGGGS